MRPAFRFLSQTRSFSPRFSTALSQQKRLGILLQLVCTSAHDANNSAGASPALTPSVVSALDGWAALTLLCVAFIVTHVRQRHCFLSSVELDIITATAFLCRHNLQLTMQELPPVHSRIVKNSNCGGGHTGKKGGRFQTDRLPNRKLLVPHCEGVFLSTLFQHTRKEILSVHDALGRPLPRMVDEPWQTFDGLTFQWLFILSNEPRSIVDFVIIALIDGLFSRYLKQGHQHGALIALLIQGYPCRGEVVGAEGALRK